MFINKSNLFLCVYLNNDHIALQNELEAYICFYILGAIMKKGNLLIENCKQCIMDTCLCWRCV